MLTVLMATHNGSDTIERSLAALAGLKQPAGGWKLVIVNNGSTDTTEEIILRWKDRLPLDYMLEPRLGKNFALNSGIARLAGDLLIVTDDDVLPDADWLVEWRRIVDTNPDFDIFGGAIIPEYAVEPPAWLEPWCRSVFFAESRPNLSQGPVKAGDIYGANMGIRRSIVDSGARFDESLLVGLGGLLGDETEFLNRLSAAGHRAYFMPTARLRHIVHANQMSWRWMLRRSHRHGRSLFLFETRRRAIEEPQLFGAPRYLIRRIVARYLQLPFIGLSFDQARLFKHLRSLAYDIGAFDEARALARRAKLSRPVQMSGAGSHSEDSVTLP